MKIIKNSDVILRDIHSISFLIHTKEKYCEKKSIVKINEVGKEIWTLLYKNCFFEEILNHIITKFNIQSIDIEMVKNDIIDFLDNLYKLGYLKYE